MRLDELSLPEIDIFDPQFAADPHATFRRARERGAWLAKYQFGYLPLDFESVRFFFRADDVCRPPNRDITIAWNAQNTTFARFFDHMLLALSGEEHRRLRRIVAPAFTSRQANNGRLRMRELLRETVGGWLPAGRCDFSQAISPYPIGLICELIGIPRADVPKFAGWLEKLESAYAQDARALPELNRIIGEIFAYIDGVLERRRRASEKPADLLQALLDATTEGGLSDEELRCLLTVLLGAGYDTTKNQLTFIVYLMTQHPEHWLRAARDKEFVKPLIEESLRYMSPIGAMHRVTNVEIEYRSVTIPPNTFFSLSQNVPGRIRPSTMTRIVSTRRESVRHILHSGRVSIPAWGTSSHARCSKRRSRCWRTPYSSRGSRGRPRSARRWEPGGSPPCRSSSSPDNCLARQMEAERPHSLLVLPDGRRALEDKTALVIGASRGIGAAAAAILARNGARVVLAARGREPLEALAASLREEGHTVRTAVVDANDAKSIASAVEFACAQFGSLQIAVNNAGMALPHKPLAETDMEDFDRLMRLNARGVFAAMQSEIPAMLRGGGGSIVNVSSVGGTIGSAGRSSYVASKHALNGLTKSAALEYAKDGIRINAVAPGVTQTDLIQAGMRADPGLHARMIAAVPMGRIAEPVEIANAIVWLASDFASFVTGSVMMVDGGFTVP